eukprot:tig00020660_g12502.t1
MSQSQQAALGISCFHASGTLRLEDGRPLRLDDPALRSGRGLPRSFRVQAVAPDGSLRPIFRPRPFVRVATRSSSLTLTPGHFLYVAEAPSWSAARVEMAARVRKGHFVFVEPPADPERTGDVDASGDGGRLKLVAEEVTAVEELTERGAFGFWVEGGVPVVSGVAASVSAVSEWYFSEDELRGKADWKVELFMLLHYYLHQTALLSARLTHPFFLALSNNPLAAFERFAGAAGHVYVCVAVGAALAASTLAASRRLASPSRLKRV